MYTLQQKGIYKLRTTYRGAVLAICSAYRTVSYDATSIIAALPTIELLVEERVSNLRRWDRLEVKKAVICGYTGKVARIKNWSLDAAPIPFQARLFQLVPSRDKAERES